MEDVEEKLRGEKARWREDRAWSLDKLTKGAVPRQERAFGWKRKEGGW